LTEKHILRDLGDCLVLRRATPDDTEALVSFNAKIHGDFGPDKPDEYVAAWTRDLLTKQHPLFCSGRAAGKRPKDVRRCHYQECASG